MKTSEIKFSVTLDDKNMPQKIDWSASDGGVTSSSRAIMLSVWDAEEKNTLRIDLWTKEMMVDEMKQFYHQTLLSMADTLERATGEKEAAKAMKGFAQEFGERLNLMKKNPLFPAD
ncbi:MAG TPA: gliding motility protein GldC [Gallionella sp.]|jgi:gliding motility-associated protein GldC|nr:gliding motility protein GldC [Gallionella sp.]OGS67355.1 MAG: gliding motility protein GldC [Gallionellales bacterium GWA2_54_124]OGT19440.1 MAG: gliding motility protein GldC [Gallionellales bacterium RIFOXYD12_FULL_53_10]OGT43929.1 MAG: gliding motility protein GldC [Gallionellales bacterium RIFOXYD2_FULL_52_7]HCI52169.1 gliding motility protein GldC [Gallionella sp.]